jgi:hypothetical protein
LIRTERRRTQVSRSVRTSAVFLRILGLRIVFMLVEYMIAHHLENCLDLGDVKGLESD